MITARETLARAVEEAAELRQVSRADFNVIAARAEVDADGLRGGGHGRSYVFFIRSRSAWVTVIRRQKPV